MFYLVDNAALDGPPYGCTRGEIETCRLAIGGTQARGRGRRRPPSAATAIGRAIESDTNHRAGPDRGAELRDGARE
jgi:hypothetical protein